MRDHKSPSLHLVAPPGGARVIDIGSRLSMSPASPATAVVLLTKVLPFRAATPPADAGPGPDAA